MAVNLFVCAYNMHNTFSQY